MAFLVPAKSCRHEPAYPFRGMVVLRRDAETVSFRCQSCGAEHTALRCPATSSRTGEQCRIALATGQATCLKHRGSAL